MNTVSLDVHDDATRVCATKESGEVIFEVKVPTEMATLRSLVAGLPGAKRVVFEEGPLSAALHDALDGVADEVISCDPTRNAAIARDENANDESDARALATLARAGAIRGVFAAPEPYRTLRSLLSHDHGLARTAAATKTRIRALCRRLRIPAKGAAAFSGRGRAAILEAIASPGMRVQMESLWALLDHLVEQRRVVARAKRAAAAQLPEVKRMQTVPGAGPVLAQTMAAWIVDPDRFVRRSRLNACVGLGLGRGFANWKPVGKAKASRRGNRQIKRVLLLGAMAATARDNALARRYRARRAMGWEHAKAIRDTARTMVWIMRRLWKKEVDYDDALVNVPDAAPDAAKR